MSPGSRILDSYRNFLVPPPARGPNVCVTCRRGTDGFTRCWQCNRHHREFGSELADEVVPISLAEKDKQLARVLSQYKNSKSDQVRRKFTNELACVLAAFLARHQHCLDEFDLVTVVPSSQGRTPPLADVLGRRISLTRGRFAETLVARSGNTREMRPDHCEVVADVRGKRVLLIDDTWTTGASLQSAAVALKRAGAARGSAWSSAGTSTNLHPRLRSRSTGRSAFAVSKADAERQNRGRRLPVGVDCA